MSFRRWKKATASLEAYDRVIISSRSGVLNSSVKIRSSYRRRSYSQDSLNQYRSNKKKEPNENKDPNAPFIEIALSLGIDVLSLDLKTKLALKATVKVFAYAKNKIEQKRRRDIALDQILNGAPSGNLKRGDLDKAQKEAEEDQTEAEKKWEEYKKEMGWIEDAQNELNMFYNFQRNTELGLGDLEFSNYANPTIGSMELALFDNNALFNLQSFVDNDTSFNSFGNAYSDGLSGNLFWGQTSSEFGDRFGRRNDGGVKINIQL